MERKVFPIEKLLLTTAAAIYLFNSIVDSDRQTGNLQLQNSIGRRFQPDWSSIDQVSYASTTQHFGCRVRTANRPTSHIWVSKSAYIFVASYCLMALNLTACAASTLLCCPLARILFAIHSSSRTMTCSVFCYLHNLFCRNITANSAVNDCLLSISWNRNAVLFSREVIVSRSVCVLKVN